MNITLYNQDFADFTAPDPAGIVTPWADLMVRLGLPENCGQVDLEVEVLEHWEDEA